MLRIHRHRMSTMFADVVVFFDFFFFFFFFLLLVLVLLQWFPFQKCWSCRGSNPEPSELKSDTLPIELQPLQISYKKLPIKLPCASGEIPTFHETEQFAGSKNSYHVTIFGVWR